MTNNECYTKSNEDIESSEAIATVEADFVIWNLEL